MITLRIDIEPRGKGRPRFGKGRTFTDAKTRAYESRIQGEARLAMTGHRRLDGPVHVHVTAFMPIPKSWSIGKQQMAIQGALRPTSKPDGDNLLKAACDPLNGIVWDDDAQIVEATVIKRYSSSPALVVVARAA